MGESYSLGAYLGDGSITLKDIPSKKHPGGKSYRFESPDVATGLWIKNLIAFGQASAIDNITRASAQEGVAGDEASAALVKLAEKVGELELDDDDEIAAYRQLMGPTLDEMIRDGIKWSHLSEIYGMLLREWGGLQTISQAITAPAGEAQAQPNREARRASGRSSSPKAGSKSNRASSGTKAPRTGTGSTRTSATSAARKRPARKTA